MLVCCGRTGRFRLTGDLHIIAAGVDVEGETRVTLCRCGQSKHKPFCDNSHKDIHFVAEERPPSGRETSD
ncbi:MAG: CDGSH iron-sulfur domain-containing protein [Chloroflexi bacterium]|nr:CDGSH iron-sulfur domain-containing protein [Chloroflexota bacterium]